MKQINEMTDAELQERLEVLKGLAGAEDLCAKIEAELKSREEARKAEQVENQKEAEKALRRKQHDVLGKFYRLGKVHYKVVGVLFDKVFLECVAVCNVRGYEGTCKTYTARQIDTLLSEGVEVTEAEYLANRVNVNETFDSLTKAVTDVFNSRKDIFNDWLDMFRGFGGGFRF